MLFELVALEDWNSSRKKKKFVPVLEKDKNGKGNEKELKVFPFLKDFLNCFFVPKLTAQKEFTAIDCVCTEIVGGVGFGIWLVYVMSL